MEKTAKIFVAGGTGLVGSAIIRNLIKKGYKNIVSNYHNRKPTENLEIKWVKLDLTNQKNVKEFFDKEKIDYVFLAAAKVGGIYANNIYRADFIYQNLQIQNNVIHESYRHNVKKLLFLGSTCIYPKFAKQPIKEEELLTGELEYTNEPYAIAKIAGLKLCESYNIQYGTNFLCVMPTNLYGYNDNFDLETSHVLPALLRKIHLGKLLEKDNFVGIKKDLLNFPITSLKEKNINIESLSENELLSILKNYGIYKKNGKVYVEIWGSGSPKREFLWTDDLADACIYLMENYSYLDILKIIYGEDRINTNNLLDLVKRGFEIKNTHINIGTGEDISIKDLAYLIKNILNFKGEFYFNTSKPDGTPRKVTDIARLKKLGWEPKTSLEEGIRKLYEWYISRQKNL